MNLFAVLLSAAAVATSVATAAPLANTHSAVIHKVAITKPSHPAGHNTHAAISKWGRRIQGPTFNTSLIRLGAGEEEALERRGSAVLYNSDDLLYNAPVTLGNGQSFLLDLDTGSSDTWFRGPNCKSSDQSCGLSSQTKVNTADTTLKATSYTWSTLYGSGSVGGKVYTGPVAMAGLSATISLGVSTSETGFSGVGDGLMGLAYASISEIASAGASNTNWIDALKLSTNEFAFYLSRASGGDNGEVTVGGVDTSKYTGSISYIPLNSKTYWQMSWSGAKWASGSSSGALDGSVKSFIADTGTSLIILDNTSGAAINKAIGATYSSTYGAYTIPCSKSTSGPTVTLTINGVAYPLPAVSYVIPLSSTVCISGFTTGASSAGVGILGDVFLRQFYSIYDKANGRVGFATAVHP
ncbi:aspartic peptidase domain-containing protein [Zopfochytrium polystomum]|nr:aspartic peptidase domain-containing protein [Zopfochytrium polystomum]